MKEIKEAETVDSSVPRSVAEPGFPRRRKKSKRPGRAPHEEPRTAIGLSPFMEQEFDIYAGENGTSATSVSEE
jgi:hypothetical protein